MRGRVTLAAVALLLAAAVVALGVAASTRVTGWTLSNAPAEAGTPAGPDGTVTITVARGDTARSIGDKLQRAGVVRSATWFRMLAKADGIENDLAAGSYSFQRNADAQSVLDRMKTGILTPQILVTIPEGLRMEQIAALLQQKGVTQAAPLLEAMQNGSGYTDGLLAGRPTASLQGYLFPDTYYFPLNATPDQVIREMLNALDQRVDPELRTAIQASGLSIYQALTVASLVEREAQTASERPIIAAVFLNRLKQGMPLQADPTVQYAVAQDPASVAQYGWWKTDLTVDDLKLDSPYNTYLAQGLPPGPICDPGRDAIAAVAHPAETNYLYFVAKGDGTHAFAATLAEHNANVLKYQHH